MCFDRDEYHPMTLNTRIQQELYSYSWWWIFPDLQVLPLVPVDQRPPHPHSSSISSRKIRIFHMNQHPVHHSSWRFLLTCYTSFRWTTQFQRSSNQTSGHRKHLNQWSQDFDPLNGIISHDHQMSGGMCWCNRVDYQMFQEVFLLSLLDNLWWEESTWSMDSWFTDWHTTTDSPNIPKGGWWWWREKKGKPVVPIFIHHDQEWCHLSNVWLWH